MSDSENESIEKELKVVLLGDCCAGKVVLFDKFYNENFCRFSEKFLGQYFPTLGVDFFLKRITLQKAKNVTLKIWDVGGTSYNGSMLDTYIYESNIIIFIYDVTNQTSFGNIPIWLELVKNILKNQEKQPLFALMGNKCDLEHQRVIKIEKHQKFASEHHLFSQIVSARTGECVSLSFQKITAEYLGLRLTKSEIEEHQPVVKAEISTYSDLPPQPVRNLSGSRSSVCSVQ